MLQYDRERTTVVGGLLPAVDASNVLAVCKHFTTNKILKLELSTVHMWLTKTATNALRTDGVRAKSLFKVQVEFLEACCVLSTLGVEEMVWSAGSPALDIKF